MLVAPTKERGHLKLILILKKCTCKGNIGLKEKTKYDILKSVLYFIHLKNLRMKTIITHIYLFIE